MPGKTCGDCARFKVPDSGCTYALDIRQGIMIATDTACDDFYPKRKKANGKQVKQRYKDSGLAEEGYFEAIYHNDKPAFLIKSSEGFIISETVECNGETFQPKDVKRIPYDSYGYYKGKVTQREDLFWKIREEFHSFIDVEPIWQNVLAACVMFTYQQEKLLTVPYIFVYGDNESGKSTVLQLLKFLCYRPMYGVTVPAADIYGYLEDVDSIGCVLEDEVQGIRKDIDKIKIYKAGYKRGAVVPRTVLTQYDRIIKYYNTFSFKAVASEQIPQVKGFRERFIEIAMVEGYPDKEWTDITSEDLKRLNDLRNMLLKWRLLSREWQLPEPKLSMRGRLKELWKPILQITDGLTVYETLADFVEKQKNERLSSRQNTLEGHLVKAVTELHNEAEISPVPHIPFQTIWLRLAEDLEGKIDDQKPHVMDTSEFFRVTKNKVGYRLREILSGKSKTVREKDVTVKAYEFNHEKLRRVARKYGYELVTKLPMLPSSEGVGASDSTLKHHENDVEKERLIPQQLGNVSNSVTIIRNMSEPSEAEWICKFCGKPGRGLYDKIFGPSNEDYPAHFDCAKQWRVNKGFGE